MGNFHSTADTKAKQIDEQIIVDGGACCPLGVYSTEPDYDKEVLIKLIIARKIAPFYKGIEDFDSSFDSHTTGQQDKPKAPPCSNATSFPTISELQHNHLLLKKSSSASFKDAFHAKLKSHSNINTTTGNNFNLYKYAVECPICFLYYPRNINFTRCCDQPICTECFVQIKRSDINLDPTSCPYCVQPDFGCIYAALGSPLFHERYESQTNTIPNTPESQRITPKKESNPSSSKRRKSLSLTDPGVVSSDDIRPTFIHKQQEADISRQATANQRSRLALRLTAAQARGTDISLELSTAASAAASLIENLHSSSLFGLEELLGTNRISSTLTRSRSGRRGVANSDTVRMMGADMEEIMLMEAMRRSMLDTTPDANNNNNGSGGENSSSSAVVEE